MDIEGLAVAAVLTTISKTNVLSPFISFRDKEPSWDGAIYICEAKQKNKKNLKRIPVQVKGELTNDCSSNTIKYPVETIDLGNYLDNGGCVYFVVYLDKNGENPRIYFTSLLPFKIKQIMAGVKPGQKTKSIELKEFPKDNDKKVATLLAFHSDMEKQASFIHVPMLSLEEYEKQGLVEEIGFTVTGYGKNRDFRDWIFQNDLYLYARIKGSPIPHPIEMIGNGLHVGQQADADISVNGKCFYNSIKRIYTKDDVTVAIGNSCNLVVSKVNNERKITFTPTSNLKHIVIDYEFILAVYENDGFEINGNKLQFDCKTMFPADRIENIANNLEYARKVEKLFDLLRLKKDYDLSKASQNEMLWISRLIHGLIDLEQLSFDSISNTLSFSKIGLVGTKVLIEFDKVAEPNTYRVFDFFDGNAVFWLGDPNDSEKEKIPISRFTILKESDFAEIGNIDYQKIILDFENYNDAENFSYQTRTLLEALKAYDQSNDLRKDLLDFSERLARSLLEREKDESGKVLPIHQLNAYQVTKRSRDLTRQEKEAIFAIAEDPNQGEDMRTGAYLLLDNQLAAEAHFAKLTEQIQEEFRSYPIYRFWKHE